MTVNTGARAYCDAVRHVETASGGLQGSHEDLPVLRRAPVFLHDAPTLGRPTVGVVGKQHIVQKGVVSVLDSALHGVILPTHRDRA
eukprot:7378340-Lingulodinium_polyedra.AAC.1